VGERASGRARAREGDGSNTIANVSRALAHCNKKDATRARMETHCWSPALADETPNTLLRVETRGPPQPKLCCGTFLHYERKRSKC
jgi:hypothetical protein